MKKKLIFGAMVGLLVVTFVGCSANKSDIANAKESDGKVKVMASIYPVKELTEIIGGDKVSVSSMVPDGAEPHDFEPKAKDMVKLNDSQLFVYNGLGMEHWVDKVLESVNNKNLTVVNTSKNANVILVNNNGEHTHENEELEEGHSHDDGHDHGRQDPHIWLSLTEVKNQAKLIEEGLIKVDNANKDYYTANYNKFVTDVDAIAKEYGEKFSTLSNKEFITGHAAFAYLCRDFGLNQRSVEDAFGEGEVTPKHLKEVADYAKANNIKVVFMPDTASEKLSETLANEVGAKVVKISSLETKNGDKSYLQTMRDNLDTIYNNLK